MTSVHIFWIYNMSYDNYVKAHDGSEKIFPPLREFLRGSQITEKMK